MDEDAFDLFGTSTVRVHKETEEEKRSRQLNERREALGLRPVQGDYELFWGRSIDPRMFEYMRRWYDEYTKALKDWKDLYTGLDPAKGKDRSYKWYYFDDSHALGKDWRYTARIVDVWERPWEPTAPVLVPLPKYKAATAIIDLSIKPDTPSPKQPVIKTEPAWLKLRGKYK